MNIKNLSQFILTVLLLSSCFKNNCDLRMEGAGTGTQEKKDDDVDLYAASIYDKFTSLVDNAEASIDEVMEFLGVNNNNKYLDGSNGEKKYPFIHYVVERGDTKLVEEMVTKYSDLVNYKAGESNPEPLHIAAREGHIDIVELLVKNKADVNAVDDKKNTVLHYACSATENVSKGIFELLIDMGAKPELVNEAGSTVLYVAINCRNEVLAKYLINKYPQMVNGATFDGELTPLHLSVILNCTSVFKIIFESRYLERANVKHIDALIDIALKRKNSYILERLKSIRNG
jgi:ankyrin repeat protein